MDCAAGSSTSVKVMIAGAIADGHGRCVQVLDAPDEGGSPIEVKIDRLVDLVWRRQRPRCVRQLGGFVESGLIGCLGPLVGSRRR